MELHDASLFTPVRQIHVGRKPLLPENAARSRARANLRDHFADIRRLVASEDPRGAGTEPYELVVPGDGLPPTFPPLGHELRPSEISAAARASKTVAFVSPGGIHPLAFGWVLEKLVMKIAV